MKNTTLVTSKGQITIPASIRQYMNIKAGEHVYFNVLDNKVIFEKSDWKSDLVKIHKEVISHLKKNNIKSLSDEELDKAINESSQDNAIKRYKRVLDN